MVSITEPALIRPSITSNLLALLLDIAPAFRIFATDSKVVASGKFEIRCSTDIVWEKSGKWY